LHVLNASGQAVELNLEVEAGKFRKKTVEIGRWRHVYYGNWIRARQLSAGGCLYSYDLNVSVPLKVGELTSITSNSYGEDFGLQIEPDFSLYLRPSGGSQPLAGAELAARQPVGFPLRPVSKVCA
jgi:hypothetical protein